MKEHFHNLAKSFWSNFAKIPPYEHFDLHKQLEIHKKLFNIFQAGRYYLFVFNHIDVRFDYFSESIEDVLGYKNDEFNVDVFLDSIHPDDQPYFLKFEELSIEFLNTLSYDQIKNYKFQADYRLRDKSGKYHHILQQLILIQYDENKNYFRSFASHTDITHLKKDAQPTFSIFGYNGEPSYLNIEDIISFTKPKDLFTKKEVEIIKCIVEGKTSTQIADELCNSIHTINTHRKKIMKKANCKTPAELAVKAYNESWV